ncbi:SIS domain-containing protein [Leucobacter sp. CSA1]|uniref:SIS domain-containing protein n=1 Tax=Leucobacter chromiisoli TaxID=2796471 RepID=A0A934Q7T1_9MICO|nr:6-phospho-3-hexuloisomerase [Leucobacter chromiisoli]MBK0419053.1 SIS domain-containing protein [Leucobacter chromiisoli]
MDRGTDRHGAWLTTTGELAEVAERLDADAYEAFASRFDGLSASSRVFFTGQGRSGLAARMVAMRFMHMDLPSSFVGEATAPSIAAGDTLVVISGSGKTPVSVNFAEVARGVGARVLLVTHQQESPLQDLADAAIVIPATSAQFGGTLFEESALVLLDSIVLDQMNRRGTPHELMAARHTNFL